jgi:hypothetical protein
MAHVKETVRAIVAVAIRAEGQGDPLQDHRTGQALKHGRHRADGRAVGNVSAPTGLGTL